MRQPSSLFVVVGNTKKTPGRGLVSSRRVSPPQENYLFLAFFGAAFFLAGAFLALDFFVAGFLAVDFFLAGAFFFVVANALTSFPNWNNL